MFIEDIVDQAVLLCLLRGHIVVALGVALDCFQRLAGVLAQQGVHPLTDAHDVVSMDLDIGGLAGDALTADERLMDQDLGVGQRKALTLGAAGQQERAHGAAMPTQMVETSHLM